MSGKIEWREYPLHSIPRVSRLLQMGEAIPGPRVQTLDLLAALGRASRRSSDRDCFRTLLAASGKAGEALGFTAGEVSQGMGKGEWRAAH